ncbi:redoxin domain-containing protein [uncultured Paraglaciecola sp.]|uniref:redoxin domain-containing protein n=1 Tax=uncultured Paraglaciecola sp. TaxID=1765024 RepID=UPI0030DD5731|tara:strand:+ start:54878 stop:55408 length:531 start_codon:yes stop_codon:yes gene_type:complete
MLFLNKIYNKLKATKWHILLRDILVIVAIYLAITTWQSRNMLEVDSHIEFDAQLLVGLDGQVNTVFESDKPTLIYFFAPWCSVCSLSIGNLEYLNADKVNIVRIALDYSSLEEVQTFADEHQISSQILLGHKELKQQFKIQGYPTYYIMDEQQKVLAKSFGYSTALGLRLRQFFSG